MTAAAPPRGGRFARLLNGGWSTGLFVIGALFDTVCVMNVPGAAVFAGGTDPTASVTTRGVLLALLAIACWATVFVRARYPLVVVGAGVLLMILGVSYALALVGVYSALVRWPQRTRIIAAATVGGVFLFVLREVLTDWGHALPWLAGMDPRGDATSWTVATIVLAVLSLALVAGLVALRRARAEASVSRIHAEEQHRRADALDEQVARQAERERIARDLHDGLGHRLSSMALVAGAFESQVAAAPVDPALVDWARQVRHQAHAALEDVRGVVGGLRSDAGADAAQSQASLRLVGGLLADLRAAGHRIEAYVVLESTESIGPARDAAAYRVVQESLTNTIKHAPGTWISVFVDAAPDRGIRLRVVNPLVASATGLPGGQRGIQGIRERTAAVGGTVWIGPHGGQFIVDVSLPWA